MPRWIEYVGDHWWLGGPMTAMLLAAYFTRTGWRMAAESRARARHRP